MKRLMLGLATLLLVGCPAPSGTSDRPNPGHVDPGNGVAADSAVLELVPEFRDGGYQTAAEVKNYTRTDIKRLDIELIRLEKDGETWKLPATLTADNRKLESWNLSGDGALRFTGLRPNTTYRIRWFAYDTAVNVTPANLISKPGERDVPIGIEELVHGAKLTVELKDRPFNASATLDGIEVRDGGYTYEDSEGIEFVEPN